MGICYSSSGKTKKDQEVENWWNRLDDGKELGTKKINNFDSNSKSKRSYSTDFSSFIGKFSIGVVGGGASGGATNTADALVQVPGRLVSNGTSVISSLYTQQGKKGTNQDAMIVWENFDDTRKDTIFCGVFDGHGPYGHMVARKVRDSLPVLLSTQWRTYSNDNADAKINGHGGLEGEGEGEWSEALEQLVDEEEEEREKVPESYLPLKQSMLKAFKLMDKELKFNASIDCFCSGSTAVTLVKQGRNLIIGNVGDSRAILATRDKDGVLTAVQLTVDLKPNLPREAARIQQCKGRVFALQDEPEVARVWLPNSDSPGLAMARAFGDFCLKDFGLISVPDVYYRHLTDKDEFIVLASDGIWDVLSNKEVVDVVAATPSHDTAGRALVECATRAWRLKYPTSKVDDCAVVCLFLNHTSEENVLIKSDENTMVADTRTLEDDDGKTGEIVPISELTDQKHPDPDTSSIGQSKRSLADCLSTTEEEEWSALEGISRVNSLLSIPRFLSNDKRSNSWRKWL
ncbi:probable protein phosphatase 2C 66 [Impatiens glandulifera]|uniref:probable protein phosphatase 2C 66 n=1 Tax=Impatiens glandulifera TaxID=253017 RepID=UPI001FB12767|nr:probable protein phosphatase 2C 66 [Impatiens glandulifera]